MGCTVQPKILACGWASRTLADMNISIWWDVYFKDPDEATAG